MIKAVIATILNLYDSLQLNFRIREVLVTHMEPCLLTYSYKVATSLEKQLVTILKYVMLFSRGYMVSILRYPYLDIAIC